MKTRFGKLSTGKVTKVASLLGLAVLVSPAMAFAVAGEFAGGVFVTALCDIYYYMGGSLGALLMATAMLFGVAGAAFGNLKPIITSVGVGIASFAMYSVMTMYFPAYSCAAPSGGRARKATETLTQTPTIVERVDSDVVETDVVETDRSWNTSADDSD